MLVCECECECGRSMLISAAGTSNLYTWPDTRKESQVWSHHSTRPDFPFRDVRRRSREVRYASTRMHVQTHGGAGADRNRIPG
jgi:hypothetical protein